MVLSIESQNVDNKVLDVVKWKGFDAYEYILVILKIIKKSC